MNSGSARKRIAYVLIGGLLMAGCGLLVFMGLILSWRSPWHDLERFLKFVLHPATLGLLLGVWLFVRGIFMREVVKDRQGPRSTAGPSETS